MAKSRRKDNKSEDYRSVFAQSAGPDRADQNAPALGEQKPEKTPRVAQEKSLRAEPLTRSYRDGSGSLDRAGKRQSDGQGLTLFGALVGLAAGIATYVVGEFWLQDAEEPALALTTMAFIVSAAIATLLLVKRGDFPRSSAVGALLAFILTAPNYTMAAAGQVDFLSGFPVVFWYLVSGPVCALILAALARATLDGGAPPAYHRIFDQGVTIPLIIAGAQLFAGLALILLFAWAKLLEAVGVAFFMEVFSEAFFAVPFLGLVGGLSIALMRGQEAVLGALRYVLLLFCRVITPIMAVFLLTFLAVVGVNGPEAVFVSPYPAGVMIGLSIVSLLVFNGVYQNGEGAPPPAWLRLSSIITVLSLPAYVCLAAYAFWLRVDQYGLTPPRIAGLVINGLVALYSVGCAASLITEVRWKAKRWLPLMAPFNTGMAVIVVVTLIIFSTPLVNTWQMSARSQVNLLTAGKISASEYDYGYLRFELGEYGERALQTLENATDAPEADEIRIGVARARAAESRYEYRRNERERREGTTEAAPAMTDPVSPPTTAPERSLFNDADPIGASDGDAPDDDASGMDAEIDDAGLNRGIEGERPRQPDGVEALEFNPRIDR
ncbi:MAG: hypothetical protein AAF850_09840 [Pseudomonadota bacterium]